MQKKQKVKEALVAVSVRLPESLVEELSEVAEKSGRKLQVVYSMALRRGVETIFRNRP
jgi:predicted transcriptional regulator